MGKYLTVLIIVIAGLAGIGVIGWFYYFIFSMAGFPLVFRILIVLAASGLMAALIYVGIERFHEIEEEDSDDLGKY